MHGSEGGKALKGLPIPIFTAATCGISFNNTLSVNTLLLFFNNILYKNYSTYTSCKELTLWNKPLGYASHYRKAKITNIERNMIQLTPRVRSIIVGLILSDGWMSKNGHWNPRLGLKQSVPPKNFHFLWNLYNELAYLCSAPLYKSKKIMRGKPFYSLSFQTRQLGCFIEIWNLFYILVNKNFVKSIKYDLFFYMNYIVLAFWIQKNGGKHGKGLVLNTQSFTLNEVILLINILIIKFDINPYLQNYRGNYIICISDKDLNKIIPKIKPYFVDSMLYKLSIKKGNNLPLNNKSYFNNFKPRMYSSLATTQQLKINLDPNWVTGFTDGEGSFIISVRKNSKSKSGWMVDTRFSIALHKKDWIILELIQKYFGVGNIFKNGENGVQFRVESLVIYLM